MPDTPAVQKKSTANVWVFIVDSDHGTNVSVHATREEAEGANYEYCDEWWHRECGDAPRPSDDQLVAEYWRRQQAGGGEWHLITECTMPVPAPDESEIDKWFDLASEFGNRLQSLREAAQEAINLLVSRHYEAVDLIAATRGASEKLQGELRKPWPPVVDDPSPTACRKDVATIMEILQDVPGDTAVDRVKRLKGWYQDLGRQVIADSQ